MERVIIGENRTKMWKSRKSAEKIRRFPEAAPGGCNTDPFRGPVARLPGRVLFRRPGPDASPLRRRHDPGEGPLARAEHVLPGHGHVGLDVAHLLAVPRD